MKRFLILLGIASLFGGLIVQFHAESRASRRVADGPEPVEEDMHEFMEYVFQPSYLRARAAMADPPTDNAGWKAIKAEALTLAEAANLLYLRAPEDRSPAWNTISGQVREAGGRFYAAARGRDFEASRDAYVTMLDHCNRCHQEFADGEHQLEP